MKPLKSFSDVIYSITRIIVGFVFAQHGAQKLFAVLGRNEAVDLISVPGLAGIIEFFGGGLSCSGCIPPGSPS